MKICLAVALACWFAVATTAQAAPDKPSKALELGFEQGAADTPPEGWRVLSAGWRAGVSNGAAAEGQGFFHFAPGDSAQPTGVCARWLDAAPYRNQRVVLRAKVRTAGKGQAQLWLRADLPNDRQGAFDNMFDRPVRGRAWSDATIDLDIDADAERLVVGVMAIGGATVDVDALSLEVLGPAEKPSGAEASQAAMSPRELDNAVAATPLLGHLWFFHPSKAAVRLRAWDRFAVALMAAAQPATSADELVRRLREVCAPLAVGVQIWTGGPEQAPPLPEQPREGTLWSWQHNGAGRVAQTGSIYTSTTKKTAATWPLAPDAWAACFTMLDLGGGACARVPVRVPVNDDSPAAVDAAWAAADAPRLSLEQRSTRLATVAMAWSVFEHFYPYFDVVDVDWAAALPKTLAAAATAPDAAAFTQELSAMVALLRDGHGYVGGSSSDHGALPVHVMFAGDELVVVGRSAPARDQIDIGDVITAIDGKPVSEHYREVTRTISASTEGFRRHRAATSLMTELRLADPTRLDVRGADGKVRTVSVPRAKSLPRNETKPRPAQASELASGIVYFNLDQAENDALEKALPTLAAAKGLVFDLRGYPGSAGSKLMEYLITEKAQSAHWIVPQVTEPGRDKVTWRESGRWQMSPKKPHIGGKVAFLTDGRAISYAESVMGIVEAYELGAIVGSNTAGTNGNVNPFTLPGRIQVSWTGMRVLKHDRSRHHGVGIAPTVPVVPTPAGIAAGRDEVLEKAVAWLQQEIDK